MKVEFAKMHGAGNDFIVVNCLGGQLNGQVISSLAVKTCDRNFGIGGDGLVLVLPSETADYRMQIMNTDGSEAEMCGNAIRCFARYLVDRGIAGKRMTVETLAGVKAIDAASLNGRGIGFRVNMGAPSLEAADIPIQGFEGPVISKPLEVHGAWFEITCVSMGNPHCVIFSESVDGVPLEKWGPKIETHPAFPRKTNVEFAQVIRRDELKVRVWERGVGITLACGTGACASVVAGVLNDIADRRATVHLPGGDLIIDWTESGEVYMTGPAEEVFTGSFKL